MRAYVPHIQAFKFNLKTNIVPAKQDISSEVSQDL